MITRYNIRQPLNSWGETPEMILNKTIVEDVAGKFILLKYSEYVNLLAGVDTATTICNKLQDDLCEMEYENLLLKNELIMN